MACALITPNIKFLTSKRESYVITRGLKDQIR